MAMNRKRRMWLILLGIPVVLVIGGIVVLKVMFTSERLKSMVIPRVEETTGRKVGIEDISLSVFPSIALKMERVSISNRVGEGFMPDPFLTVDALRLNVKLLPLLRSRIEVTSLELDRPHLLLEVNTRNETNYQNLTTGGKAPEAAVSAPQKSSEVPGQRDSSVQDAPESSTPYAFLISKLLVSNGSMEYIDHTDNSVTRMRNLFLTMVVGTEGSNIVMTGNVTTDSLSYGTVESPMIAGLRLGLDHRMVYDVPGDQLKIEQGDITFQEIRLVLSGTVSDVMANPVLNLSVGSDSLKIPDLFMLVPGEYMKKAQGARGTGIAQVHIAITGTLTDTTSADITGTVTARGASIQYPQVPKPITDITILSGFTKTKAKQEFRIDNLTANLGGAPVRMAMTLVNFDDPSLNLSASGMLNLASVSEFYPLEKGTELSGEMKVDVRVAGKVNDPNALRASGSLTFQDVSARTANTPHPVRRLNGTVTFTDEIAESKKLSMIIGQSDMTLAWRLKNYLSLVSTNQNAPRATAVMTLQSSHIVLSDIMSEPPPPTAGEPKTASVGPPAPPSTASEVARPAQVGAARPGRKSETLLPALDMDVNAAIGTLTLEKFEFSNVRGSFRISRGLITMQNLSLNTFGGSVVSTGSLNLSNPDQPLFDLNLKLNGMEAGALLTPFTSFGQRLSGSMSMITGLKGALDDTMGLVPGALQGSGTVGIINGTLRGLKVNQSLASALSLPDLETVHFKDWTNAFTVQNGRLVVKDLTINALNGQYIVNGSQGLDGSLDYKLALYLPESAAAKVKVGGYAGEAVNFFKDQSGRLRFDFAVGGTADNPKVQLDTEAVQKRAERIVKQKLDDEKKKLEGQMKDRARDALNKLFKK